MSVYICCSKNDHDALPSYPYFILLTPLSPNMWTYFWYRLSLEDKRGLNLGELICQFCIMLLYQYLLHYGLLLHIMPQYLCLFSLILQGLYEEGECRQLGFWARKRLNIRDLLCTTPKVLKLQEVSFGIYKKYWVKKAPEGAHPPATTVEGAPSASWATWQAPGAHLLLYEGFYPEKKS